MAVNPLIAIVNLAEITVSKAVGSVLRLTNPDYMDLWLITERGTDARDNGFFFFEWLRENHPEINAVYVITEDSPDYEKVASIGRTVPFMSWRHKLMSAASKVFLSTHHDINSAFLAHYHWADKLATRGSKRVMLQHGITKDNMKYFHREWLNADLFICGAKPEYDYIKETFGYPEGAVQYTGFARYDNLLKPHDVKKQILLMPTWRSYSVRSGEETFVKSDVYKAYQSLINNQALIFELRRLGYSMVFYPHYEMQRYLKCFTTTAPDTIRIASKDYFDVQTLLMESEFLITDYSSVYFDFAYMGKPLLYYQFDEEAYRKGHYEEGYFDYRRDGFGKVCETENDLIRSIMDYLEDNAVFDEYKARTDSFFPVRDEQNCERIFKAVKNMQQKG